MIYYYYDYYLIIQIDDHVRTTTNPTQVPELRDAIFVVDGLIIRSIIEEKIKMKLTLRNDNSLTTLTLIGIGRACVFR